jgi:selT/selW/selH-like putative selenoprotein
VQTVPGARGAFEVRIEGTLVFSKLQQGRFPEPDEIFAQLKARE